MDAIRSAWIAAIAVLLLLTGCRIPNLRGAKPGQELPATIKGELSEENSAQVGIDEFFDDPLLVSYIRDALAGNQQLKILGEGIQIANNEVFKRTGAYLPFVRFGASAGLEKPSWFTLPGAVTNNVPYLPGQYFPDPLPDFLVGTNLSWQVDIWRQLRNARDSSAFRFLGTADGRNYVVTRLVADIAENYYTLMALDQQLENLDRIIDFQEKSLQFAKARKDAARDTELAVQRFQAEVRKGQSEKLIIKQAIVEAENRINFLRGRFPEPVARNSAKFLELQLHPLKLGVPSQLLRNRPDIRQAERELAAAGLDVKVARADFFPKLFISSSVGFEAFNTKYLIWTPESLIWNVAGGIVAPLINRRAIKADYMSANARQLQAIYNYQQVTINAFTEVYNRISMVENYSKSLDIKKQQLDALEASVTNATKLFQNARVTYMDVLFSQRDLRDARNAYIDQKKMQLSAIVNTYQALGGGLVPIDFPGSSFEPPKPRWPWEQAPVEEIPAQPLPEPEKLPLPEAKPAEPALLPEPILNPLPAVEEPAANSPVLLPSNLESPWPRVSLSFPSSGLP